MDGRGHFRVSLSPSEKRVLNNEIEKYYYFKANKYTCNVLLNDTLNS